MMYQLSSRFLSLRVAVSGERNKLAGNAAEPDTNYLSGLLMSIRKLPSKCSSILFGFPAKIYI